MKVSRMTDDEGKAAEEILGMISKEKIQVREIKSKDELDDIISNRVERGRRPVLLVVRKKR